MLNWYEKKYANLIGDLAKWQRNIARRIVKPDPIIKTKKEIQDFLAEFDLGVKPVFYDNNFAVDKWSKWEKAIEIDWTNTNKYIDDLYDCDDFSDNFNVRMSEYYGWNTAGRLSVALYDPKTNKLIGYHRANLIVALDEKDQLVLYGYDPLENLNDAFVKMKKGENMRIQNWMYDPTFIAFG
jgi:hypothetical protein